MLQRWPAPFRSSPSRMNRVVMPRATPVSTTLAGRRWRTECQTARTNPGSPSPHPPKAPRPMRIPFASNGPMTSGHRAQNSGVASHGHGTPMIWCSRRSQSRSASYEHRGLRRSNRSANPPCILAQASAGSVTKRDASRDTLPIVDKLASLLLGRVSTFRCKRILGTSKMLPSLYPSGSQPCAMRLSGCA